MGWFGLFGKRKSPVDKHGPRAADKRAQAPDRWESIVALGDACVTAPAAGAEDIRPAAVAALMARFAFSVDPSITDDQEKDEAFRSICKAGDLAIDPVRMALRKQDSPSWSFKILEQLLPEEKVVDEIIALLETMDTEYERDPQRKLQALATLEEKRHPGIAAAVTRFFKDVNATARFHAVGAALAQSDPSIVPAICDALLEEDSVRVKTRVLDTLAERGWSVGEAQEKLVTALPAQYSLDKNGVPRKGAAKPASKPAAAKPAKPAAAKPAKPAAKPAKKR